MTTQGRLVILPFAGCQYRYPTNSGNLSICGCVTFRRKGNRHYCLVCGRMKAGELLKSLRRTWARMPKTIRRKTGISIRGMAKAVPSLAVAS